MNKGEFISAVAENAGLTNKQTAAAFEAMVNVIESTLKADEKIALAGFATFEIKEKPEREGINPLTKDVQKYIFRQTALLPPQKIHRTKSYCRRRREPPTALSLPCHLHCLKTPPRGA